MGADLWKSNRLKMKFAAAATAFHNASGDGESNTTSTAKLGTVMAKRMRSSTISAQESVEDMNITNRSIDEAEEARREAASKLFLESLAKEQGAKVYDASDQKGGGKFVSALFKKAHGTALAARDKSKLLLDTAKNELSNMDDSVSGRRRRSFTVEAPNPATSPRAGANAPTARVRCIKVLKKPPAERTEMDLSMLVDFLVDNEFFQKLDVVRRRRLARVMKYESFGFDQNIFEVGDPGSKFYIVLSGKVAVFVPHVNRNQDGNIGGSNTIPSNTLANSSSQHREFLLKKDMSSAALTRDRASSQANLDTPLRRGSHVISGADLTKAGHSPLGRNGSSAGFASSSGSPAAESAEGEDLSRSHVMMDCVAELGVGQSFGELALLNSNPRAATVTSITTCEFMTIQRSDYEETIKSMQEELISLKMSVLRQLSGFRKVGTQEVQRLSTFFQEVSFVRNDHVLKQGEPIRDESLFLVLIRGQCRVVFEGTERELGHLKALVEGTHQGDGADGRNGDRGGAGGDDDHGNNSSNNNNSNNNINNNNNNNNNNNDGDDDDNNDGPGGMRRATGEGWTRARGQSEWITPSVGSMVIGSHGGLSAPTHLPPRSITIELATLGPGSHFGAFAIYRNCPQPLSIIAASPCTFLCMQKVNYARRLNYAESNAFWKDAEMQMRVWVGRVDAAFGKGERGIALLHGRQLKAMSSGPTPEQQNLARREKARKAHQDEAAARLKTLTKLISATPKTTSELLESLRAISDFPVLESSPGMGSKHYVSPLEPREAGSADESPGEPPSKGKEEAARARFADSHFLSAAEKKLKERQEQRLRAQKARARRSLEAAMALEGGKDADGAKEPAGSAAAPAAVASDLWEPAPPGSDPTLLPRHPSTLSPSPFSALALGSSVAVNALIKNHGDVRSALQPLATARTVTEENFPTRTGGAYHLSPHAALHLSPRAPTQQPVVIAGPPQLIPGASHVRSIRGRMQLQKFNSIQAPKRILVNISELLRVNPEL